MCDHSNAIQIVDELIKQLNDADYQFKEELVLKIAILAEKYAQDLRWYIDIILKVCAQSVYVVVVGACVCVCVCVLFMYVFALNATRLYLSCMFS